MEEFVKLNPGLTIGFIGLMFTIFGILITVIGKLLYNDRKMVLDRQLELDEKQREIDKKASEIETNYNAKFQSLHIKVEKETGELKVMLEKGISTLKTMITDIKVESLKERISDLKD